MLLELNGINDLCKNKKTPSACLMVSSNANEIQLINIPLHYCLSKISQMRIIVYFSNMSSVLMVQRCSNQAHVGDYS